VNDMQKCSAKTLVIGDSHASYCFDLIEGCEVLWLGPITMFRIGRDGFNEFIDRSKIIHAAIFVFGEIDIRHHVPRIAAQESKNCIKLIEDLVLNYIAKINCTYNIENKIVASVVPPVNTDLAMLNRSFPVFGSVSLRAELTIMINERLRWHALQNGIEYLDIHSIFSGKSGLMQLSKSDYICHVNPYQSKLIVGPLRKLIAGEFRFDASRNIQAFASPVNSAERSLLRQRVDFEKHYWIQRGRSMIQFLWA